jgi:hypothetical protein
LKIFEKISSVYDCSISLTENLKIFKELEIKTSDKTLRRFCEEYNIETNPNKKNNKKKIVIQNNIRKKEKNIIILDDKKNIGKYPDSYNYIIMNV